MKKNNKWYKLLLSICLVAYTFVAISADSASADLIHQVEAIYGEEYEKTIYTEVIDGKELKVIETMNIQAKGKDNMINAVIIGASAATSLLIWFVPNGAILTTLGVIGVGGAGTSLFLYDNGNEFDVIVEYTRKAVFDGELIDYQASKTLKYTGYDDADNNSSIRAQLSEDYKVTYSNNEAYYDNYVLESKQVLEEK